MHPAKDNYDIIIIGGGMVGASLAVALGQSRHSVLVVEAHPPRTDSQPSFDDRSIALSYGSRKILQGMGIWPALESRIQPIEHIHVSDRGHFGVTRMSAHEAGVGALGYVAENRVMGDVLLQHLESLSNVEYLTPASIESLQQTVEQVQLQIQTNKGLKTCTTPLLVAADGSQSRARELVGLEQRCKEYSQTAIITNVKTGYTHDNRAFERFTSQGPLAFLPMTEARCSVVWTVNPEDVDGFMRLSDPDFTQALQQAFGFRLGYIAQVGTRHAYPLSYMEPERLVKGRVAMVGNAAHTLHPVSGQGYNLALRDVAQLAELIVPQDDPGHSLLLSEYESQRRNDLLRVYRVTDTLVQIFSNRFPPLAHARALGLLLMDLFPPGRDLMVRQSMGLLGRGNRLMRGLSL